MYGSSIYINENHRKTSPYYVERQLMNPAYLLRRNMELVFRNRQFTKAFGGDFNESE